MLLPEVPAGSRVLLLGFLSLSSSSINQPETNVVLLYFVRKITLNVR